MTEREYLRLWRHIHAEYRRKTEALETVWRMSNSGPPPQIQKKKRPPNQASNGNGGGLVGAVKDAVEAMPIEFTTKDVAVWIRQNRPDVSAAPSSISHSLKRTKT